MLTMLTSLVIYLVGQVILIGLTGVFLTRLIRTFGWVKRRVESGVKPFSCDLCMSFWTCCLACLACTLLDVQPVLLVVVLLPSSGLCVTLLRLTADLPPPELPS